MGIGADKWTFSQIFQHGARGLIFTVYGKILVALIINAHVKEDTVTGSPASSPNLTAVKLIFNSGLTSHKVNKTVFYWLKRVLGWPGLLGSDTGRSCVCCPSFTQNWPLEEAASPLYLACWALIGFFLFPVLLDSGGWILILAGLSRKLLEDYISFSSSPPKDTCFEQGVPRQQGLQQGAANTWYLLTNKLFYLKLF